MSFKVSLAASASVLALVATAALAQDEGRQGGAKKAPESSQSQTQGATGSRASEAGKGDTGKSEAGKDSRQRSEGARDSGEGKGKGAASAQSERRGQEQGQERSRGKDNPQQKTTQGGGSQDRQAQERQGEKNGAGTRSDRQSDTQRQRGNRQAEPSSKDTTRGSGKAARDERQPSQTDTKQSNTGQSGTRQGAAPTQNPKDGSTSAQSERDRRDGRQGDAATGQQPNGGVRQGSVEQNRSVQLNDQQQRVVRERILQQRPARTNVNISVSVGSRLPRNVRTTVLPAAIVQAVPAWRGYHYVMVRDEIVIVQPSTYQVVDVIEVRGGGSGSQHAVLELTPDQRRIVYETVHERYRPVDLRIRLGLGAQIPRTVQVEVFPPDLVQRIPELERYRCVVAEDQVVIVDPGSREVVLLIDR